jgi:type IV pilus assembly protein PilB
MGVEPYLIPPVLILSIAQRLVRTFCDGGAQEFELSASERKTIEADMANLPARYRFPIPNVAYQPQRTPTCPTGLRGRMAVFELMEMSSQLERIVLENPVESKLWDTARASGMLTMREDAMMKAFERKIPFSEVNNLSRTMLMGESIEEEASTPPEKTV